MNSDNRCHIPTEQMHFKIRLYTTNSLSNFKSEKSALRQKRVYRNFKIYVIAFESKLNLVVI